MLYNASFPDGLRGQAAFHRHCPTVPDVSRVWGQAGLFRLRLRILVDTFKWNNPAILRGLLFVSLVVLTVLSIATGVQDFSLAGFLSGNDEDRFIGLISRIPRTLAIIIAGTGLSISGLIMQTLTNNKFVSPSTAGTLAWCRFGVMLAILFAAGAPTWMRVSVAFVASLAGTFCFIGLLQHMRFKNVFMVPLVGIMLGNVVSAITIFIAYRYDIIQNITSWLQGNFSLIVKGNYELLYLGLPCVAISWLYASRFTIAGMGDTLAISLGENPHRIMLLGLSIVAFTTSLIVVTVGSIPFVGLIIPNIISMLRGDNLKGTLPDTALLGSVFLLACDLAGRTVINPYEVNISVVVGIVGSIVFLALLFWRKRP